MIRYVMTVVLLVPAVSQAQEASTYFTDSSLYQQRDAIDGRCVGAARDASSLADSELVLQHKLSTSQSDRHRTNLYVGILWSIVWGGTTSYAPSEPTGYACHQRSRP